MSRIKLIFISSFILGIFCFANPAQAANSSLFSFSIWAKPQTSVASKAILGKAEELRVATNASGYPLCQIKSGAAWQTAVTSSSAIAIDQWSSIVCTYDLITFKIYINGVLKGTQALTAVADDTAAVWKIGKDDSSGSSYGYYTGVVDDFKFYNYPLTAEDVKADYNSGAAMQLGASGATSGTGAATNAASGEYCVPGDTTACAAPVGEWNFNEKVSGNGQILYDTSGNGNNGTSNDGANNTGMNCSVPGKFGTGCSFDGVDDYVDVGDQSSLYTSAGTISAWIKTGSDTAQGLLGIRGISGNFSVEIGNGVTSGCTNELVTVVVGNITNRICYTTATRNELVDNEWHFVTVTSNGLNYAIYIDGASKAITVGGGANDGKWTNYASMNNIVVGATNNIFNHSFNGLIDQVRIYNYARTPSQIAWEYNKGKPIAHWRMDEGESGDGDPIHDESGNGNHGTTVDGGNNTGMDCTVDGKFGKGCDFDGVDDYVSMGTKLAMTSPYSISTWVRPASSQAGSFRGIIARGDNNYILLRYGSGQGINADKVAFYQNNNGPWFSTVSSNSIPNNAWTHVIGVWDGSNINIYVNGTLAGTPTSVSVLTVGSGSTSFDLGHYGNEYFDGQIDDVRVYNYALTAEQVKQVMNEGAGMRF